jgi:predicted alpha-1,2-mannosidase
MGRDSKKYDDRDGRDGADYDDAQKDTIELRIPTDGAHTRTRSRNNAAASKEDEKAGASAPLLRHGALGDLNPNFDQQLYDDGTNRDSDSRSSDEISILPAELDAELESGILGHGNRLRRRFKLSRYASRLSKMAWYRRFHDRRRRGQYFLDLSDLSTRCVPMMTLKEVGATLLTMFGIVVVLVGISTFFRSSRGPVRTFDVLSYIDPLIGTAHAGHVFPGPNMPYGMAKPVADCMDDNAGGFSSDKQCMVTGFSHMHDSGTGGATSFGNFPLFPLLGCPGDNLSRCPWSMNQRQSGEVNGSTIARPGYFALELENGVSAEITATEHTALYKFHFAEPQPEKNITLSPLIMVDMKDLVGQMEAGRLEVSPETGRMQGWGRFAPSFGPTTWRFNVHGHEEWYTLYFCADFDGDIRRSGTWSGNNIFEDTNSINASAKTRVPYGGYVQFDADGATDVTARVGLSFISTDKACKNAEKEIVDFDLERVEDRAVSAWRDKFQYLQVDSYNVSTALQTVFWSGIYRTMLSPQDYTGENPLWDSDEPYFDSFYCIWDSFRSTHPFLTIFDPEAQTLMVRALLDIYKHEGKLPDCRMSLCKGNTQGGSNADVVIADALLKGITDKVNWTLAYEAVVSDAEEEPADWSLEGRGNLESWKTLGYIPVDDNDDPQDGLRTRSVSRSMEYAYDDYCVATIAKSQGRMDDYQKYIGRSLNWKKLFDPEVNSTIKGEDTGFLGFVQPKYKNGNFRYEDPGVCNPINGFVRKCYFFQGGYETYEGGSWLYSFYVPHDMADLIETMGGKDTFVKRLTFFHDSGLVDISDEQSFLTVFQYHYAGRPGLSSHRTHHFIPSSFHTGHDGIPGNDDSGSMGSFPAFCMMGFFPNPGQDVYLLTAPFFREVHLTHPQTKKVATVKAINFDGDLSVGGYKNIYIQSVRLNGKPYTKSWITHDFFVSGGLLEVVLGDKESAWGTREEDLPPSLSTSPKLLDD